MTTKVAEKQRRALDCLEGARSEGVALSAYARARGLAVREVYDAIVALLYSLIETAKTNGVEPHAYLTHLFTHLPTATTAEHFESHLPWNVKLAPASSR